jgi:peptide-methionine (R)-S-oxide reductase
VPVYSFMHRRHFLKLNAGLGAGLFLTRGLRAGTRGATADPGTVVIVKFSDSGRPIGRVNVPKIQDDARWKSQLSPLAYRVTREAGTEPAFSIPGYDRHDQGLYRCICCDNALFNSSTKYESGTGWPSFWRPIAAPNVRSNSDLAFGMLRTEILCTLCDAHLGHVFEDGPQPTGLRYCMNTVALRFVPKPAGN